MPRSWWVRPRDCFTTNQFALAIGALAEGIVLRIPLMPGYTESIEVASREGGIESWSVMGIATAALLEHMLEPDPEF